MKNSRCMDWLARCAVVLAAAAPAGCGGDNVGLDSPGRLDEVRLGEPLPAALREDARRDGLGFAVEQTGRDLLSGESRREVVRAVTDDSGKVVAVHCLRSWRRKSLFGPDEVKHKFILEARIPDPNGPATQPSVRFPLDSDLLAMARASATGQGPRIVVPDRWDQVAPALLRQLNERRAAAGRPPAAKPAETPSELLLVAEVVLESVAADEHREMAETVWGELDLAGALERIPRTLGDAAEGPLTWQATEATDSEGLSLRLGVPFVVGLSEDQHRRSGSLTNLGEERVRLVLQSEWWRGFSK